MNIAVNVYNPTNDFITITDVKDIWSTLNCVRENSIAKMVLPIFFVKR